LKQDLVFGRAITSDLALCQRREWLVTNGLGGFASGTVAGLPTRRYHGLLFAALEPPLGRRLLLAALHETATLRGETVPLHTVRWADGACDASALRHLESFRLDGTTPVWTFALADSLLTRRIAMEQGKNVTYVTYEHERGTSPLTLSIKVLVNHRDYHALTTAGLPLEVQPVTHGLRVTLDGVSYEVLAPGAETVLAADWYIGFRLDEEQARGFDHLEDQFMAATLTKTLVPGERLVVIGSCESFPDYQNARTRRAAGEAELLRRSGGAGDPPWVRRLTLAADQFLVRRGEGSTVIAGYPWFGDWGRDTMIALPGLALVTGRPEAARGILRTFARYLDRGLLPNRFPDAGAEPEYNTIDATLWYVEAIRRYVAATGDLDTLEELWPALAGILEHHTRGTRYGIGVDPEDGLLRGGEPGVQLTWMDAKAGDWVVTPRIGKPVEVNALWHQALVSMGHFARLLEMDPAAHDEAAARARRGFARFFDPATEGLYDVLDGPGGPDPSVRPNQLFAVSLPAELLPEEQALSVVELCSRRLLTSHGLRSLDPAHPDYRGRYEGDTHARDGAYHQGTVWGWLLGPFALAHQRVHGDARRALAFLEPMGRQLEGLCAGTLGEIFDGDPPHAPRGAVAQAWTVAETLRAYRELTNRM